MLFTLVIAASAAAIALCVAWLLALHKIDKLGVDLGNAKARMMPEEQYKEAEAKLEAMKREFAKRLESERAMADLVSRDIAQQITVRRKELATIEKELNRGKQNLDLAELGFQRRQFTYEDPASYQNAIEEIEDELAARLKNEGAAKCNVNWSVQGSAKKGEAMIGKLMKLAIRTFNADADAAIAKVRWNNLETMADRIRKSELTIEKTLDKWGIVIIDAYRDLKIKEMRLTFERAELDQRIKEEQRALREQQREEERARKEAEAAQSEAEREERRIATALEKAKQELSEAHTTDISKYVERIRDLENKMADATEKRERAISMAQLTKMGNVYIISNIGSFGEQVLKIGMTRRMNPMDRIWELSDASVPFDFDVHGIIKTDDAPALEAALHQRFVNRRVNLVNLRKEYFRISIKDVQEVVSALGLDVKLTLAAEAREHYESVKIRGPSV